MCLAMAHSYHRPHHIVTYSPQTFYSLYVTVIQPTIFQLVMINHYGKLFICGHYFLSVILEDVKGILIIKYVLWLRVRRSVFYLTLFISYYKLLMTRYKVISDYHIIHITLSHYTYFVQQELQVHRSNKKRICDVKYDLRLPRAISKSACMGDGKCCECSVTPQVTTPLGTTPRCTDSVLTLTSPTT